MFSRVATVSSKVVLPRSKTRFVARMSTIKVSIFAHVLPSWHCVMLTVSIIDLVFDKIDLHVCRLFLRNLYTLQGFRNL